MVMFNYLSILIIALFNGKNTPIISVVIILCFNHFIIFDNNRLSF